MAQSAKRPENTAYFVSSLRAAAAVLDAEEVGAAQDDPSARRAETWEAINRTLLAKRA